VTRLVLILSLFVIGGALAAPKLLEEKTEPTPVSSVGAPEARPAAPAQEPESRVRSASDRDGHAAWKAEEPKEKAPKVARTVDVEIAIETDPAVFVPAGDEFVVDESDESEPKGSGSAPAQSPSAGSSGSVARDTGPIRAAFYYPWFPQAWTQDGVYPFSKYKPSLGYYESSDPGVIRAHIGAMQYGNVDAGISSWWGPSDYTDENFATILAASGGTGFHWAIYYELEGTANPGVAQIQADLAYVQARYASDPSYLKIDSRFVVFVFAGSDDGCEMADRWREAAPINAYVVLEGFAGYKKCESQPDSWHVYDPFAGASNLAPQSYSISPGYSKLGDPSEVARDLARWRENAAGMALSGARLQLVVSFNEWGEGSAVESSDTWATSSGYGAYLDVLHELP